MGAIEHRLVIVGAERLVMDVRTDHFVAEVRVFPCEQDEHMPVFVDRLGGRVLEVRHDRSEVKEALAFDLENFGLIGEFGVATCKRIGDQAEVVAHNLLEKIPVVGFLGSRNGKNSLEHTALPFELDTENITIMSLMS